MATNPETIDERNQPIIQRVVEVIKTSSGSRKTRLKVALPIAAALGCLAPAPFGSFAAALVVVAALETN